MPLFAACLGDPDIRMLGFEYSKLERRTMPTKPKALFILLAITCATVLTSRVPAVFALKKHLRGSVMGDLYISAEKDFRVVIPVNRYGGRVRDEREKVGDLDASQVIFTDDFGSFYRIISTKTSRPMDDILRGFHDIRDQKTTEGEWGRELRVIDIEKEGSEITVTTLEHGNTPQVTRPDMITASAIFTANSRIYHLVAGYPVLGNGKTKMLQELVSTKLDRFLAGFQTLEPEKQRNKSRAR
jgi:hypothetical protein